MVAALLLVRLLTGENTCYQEFHRPTAKHKALAFRSDSELTQKQTRAPHAWPKSFPAPHTTDCSLLLRRMCDNHPQQWQPRWSTHPLTVACIDSLLYHHRDPTAAKTTFKFAQPAPLASQHSIKIKAQAWPKSFLPQPEHSMPDAVAVKAQL